MPFLSTVRDDRVLLGGECSHWACIPSGLDVWTAEPDLGATAGASLVADADRAVVVGATFVGPDVAELLHSATVAVVGEVPLDRLWHAVPAFPTVSQVWLRLLEHLVGRLGWEV